MGNELLNEENIKEKEPEDYTNDFLKYGLITKKGEEKSNDDNYILMPNLSNPEDGKKNNISLFGVFDGHNSDFVPNYLNKNIHKFYEKEILNINKNNFKTKIEEIFKNIDKELKGDKKKEKIKIDGPNNDEDEEKDEEKKKKEEEKVVNKINENQEEEKKEEIDYINVGVDKKEFDYIKNEIKNSKDIPDEFKEIDDNELENLLLFKNLFQYNNNYLYNNNNVNYIGSSASVVLITDDNVITADLGITKCILFNKEGNILNSKENKESKYNGDYKVEHTFSNSDEKKRIKKFNKSIDYNSLKLNFYVPASRCFGFFKYKENEILKEENQIISCVPDVYIYDKKDVDYILLITKGAAPIGETLVNFMKKIKDINSNIGENNLEKYNDMKLSDLISEYIKCKKEEGDKINTSKSSSTPSGALNKTTTKTNSSIYVGKEDFGEENVIINELNNSYYKDIMSLNKSNDCHGNYNATYILIQLFKNKINKPNEIPKPEETNKNGETKEEENKIENEIKKEEENKNEIKEEKKIENEIKKEEENKNEIKEEKKIENEEENKNNKEENKEGGEIIKNDNEIKEDKKEEESKKEDEENNNNNK